MKTNAREIFTENLKHYMNIKQKSQSDISKALDIPLSTVSSWYNGASYPRVDKMQALPTYSKSNTEILIINNVCLRRVYIQ